MEKIIRHIETLLWRHDYVIVPGFGGFVFQHQSAVISKESIEPPLVKMSFNPLMNISDGLLAIEISRINGISFREASGVISEAVDKLHHTLKTIGKAEFGRLGTIEMDEESKTIFSPSKNTHLLPANFGLSTLHYSAATLRQDEDERRTITLTLPPARKIARYAAIGVVAVGLFFAAPKLSDATQNLANFFPIQQHQQVEETPESVEPLTIAIPTEAKTQLSAEPQVSEAFSHHVIVSCMATQKDADELCAKLKRLNFDKAHVLPPIKTYRVAIQSFETKKEAVGFMEQLRKSNSQFAEAWVLSE